MDNQSKLAKLQERKESIDLLLAKQQKELNDLFDCLKKYGENPMCDLNKPQSDLISS
ncbi:hypothetical protein PANI_CDS0102 [Maribacter phage Panino]